MSLPFNPQGNLGSNQITGEVQTKTAPTGNSPVKYNFLIPMFAPFFIESMTVVITPTAKSFSDYTLGQATTLVMGKDFVPVLHFEGASLNCGKEIFGGIRFIDPALSGEVTMSYMSLGGTWTTTDQIRADIINGQVINPSATDWETATAKTAIFPQIEFSYNLQEMTLFSSVGGTLSAIASLLSTPIPTNSAIGYDRHVSDFANPHGITAEKIGLGSVPNWRLSTDGEARQGQNYSAFLTPAKAYEAITYGVVVPNYSTTVFGTTKLNNGFVGGANNQNFGLTASGLLWYKNDTGSNAINELFEYERQVVYFTPNPIPYPVLCLGSSCYNFRDLLNAVEANLKFKPIQGSAKRGCVWLPKYIAAPDLTCTPI